MTDAFRNGTLLRLVVGLGLLAMLVATGHYLIMHPSLVVHVSGGQAGETEPSGASAGADSGVVEHMQRLKEDPDNPDVLCMVARHFLGENDLARSEHLVSRACELAPKHAEAQYLLGVVRHRQGRNDEAAAALERSLALRNDAAIRYSLGVLYTHFLNQPARGQKEFSAALEAPGLSEDLKTQIARERAAHR